MAGLVPAIGVFYADASEAADAGTKPDMTTENVMSTAVSPLAPATIPDMPAVSGVRLATAEAGIRYAGRTDVLLALFDPGTTVAITTRTAAPITTLIRVATATAPTRPTHLPYPIVVSFPAAPPVDWDIAHSERSASS